MSSSQLSDCLFLSRMSYFVLGIGLGESVWFFTVFGCVIIYRWVSVSLLQFFKKIETRADDFCLCCQLQQCCDMLYHASECVVKSYNVLSHFMLIRMHFTMCCQLRQRFIIHAYFILVAPINFFLNARIK